MEKKFQIWDYFQDIRCNIFIDILGLIHNLLE